MQDYSIVGRFWMKKKGKNFLGDGRVELLRKIHASGSISKAAKEMKMSYKAAWDDVDAMNNLAQVPLVTSAAGGRKGGGTELTDAGMGLICLYEKLKKYFGECIENAQYLYNKELDHIAGQQNIFQGKLLSEEAAGQNIKLSVKMENGMTLIVLAPFKPFKKSKSKNVTLKIDPAAFTLLSSACVRGACAVNIFEGTVKSINISDGEAELLLLLSAGGELFVNISEQTCRSMGVAVGDVYCAICKEADIGLLPVY